MVADAPFTQSRGAGCWWVWGCGNCPEIWYPGLPEDKLGPIVLIFEGAGLTGEPGREYIHFYGRGMISTETLIQMAAALNMLHLLETILPEIQPFRQVRLPPDQRSDRHRGLLRGGPEKVVNGLLYFVPDGLISHCNFNAAVLFGDFFQSDHRKDAAGGISLLGEWMDRLEEFGERVVKFGGRELVFDLWTTSTHGIYADMF